MAELFEVTKSGDVIFDMSRVFLRRFSYSKDLQIINYYDRDSQIAYHLIVSKDMFYDMPMILKASELTDELLKFREHTIFICATNRLPEKEIEIPYGSDEVYIKRVLSKLPFGIGLGTSKAASQDEADQEEFLNNMKGILYNNESDNS